MAAELAFGASPRLDGDYWRRLGVLLPAVVTAWLVVLWTLGVLLESEPVPPAPKPIDAMLIELPPEPKVQQPAAEPPAAPPLPAKPRPLRRAPAPRPVLPTPSHEETRAEEAPPPVAAPALPPVPAPAPPAQARSSSQSQRTGARAVYSPLPKIPDELREEASQSQALVRFDIRADGTASVALVQPTPNPVLNRLILQTLSSWRFFPAVQDGKPVASTQEVRIRLEVN